MYLYSFGKWYVERNVFSFFNLKPSNVENIQKTLTNYLVKSVKPHCINKPATILFC